MRNFKVKYVNEESKSNGKVFVVREDKNLPHHYLIDDNTHTVGDGRLSKKYCTIIPKQTKWDYQLCDDGGISTSEDVPILLPIGSIFEHEYGKYKVIERMEINDKIEVFCDRI